MSMGKPIKVLKQFWADLFEPIVRPIGKGDELRWEPHEIGQVIRELGELEL